MLRKVLIITALMCVLAAGIVHAQTGWETWLYDAALGHLWRIDSAGTVLQEVDLPMPQGFNRYPQNVAVSHDGELLAFVATNTDTQERQLRVFNTVTQSVNISHNLPLLLADGYSIAADEGVFNETDSALAFGYLTQDQTWEIIVVEMATGQVSKTLSSTTTTLPDSPDLSGVPVVRQYAANQVTFTMVPAQTEGLPEYQSYSWDTFFSTVMATPAYRTLDEDVLQATGEAVRAVQDLSLPNTADAFPFFQTNALQVYDPTASTIFPMYNDQNLLLSLPRFVQNGEGVAFVATDAQNNPVLAMVGRDGVVVGHIEVMQILNSLEGTADGFIYVEQSGELMSLMRFDTRTTPLEGGTGAIVYTFAPGQQPRIIWVNDPAISAAASYPAWQPITDPARVEMP